MIPRAVDKRGPSSFVTMQKRVWKLRHSYGILLYARSTRQFLVIQNRDSQAFLFFFMIRDLGTWSTDRIISLMRGCTQDEIQRLLFYPFEDVYNDLYLNHDSMKFRRQEDLARMNYEYFHSRPDWKQQVLRIPGTNLPWEFPKGRKDNDHECPVSCALREKEEETGIRLTPTGAVREMMEDTSRQHDLSRFRATHYFKYKSFLGQRVLVELFGAMIEHPIPLQYRRFPHHIRSLSLSDECLHGKWIDIDEAQYMLSHDIMEVIEPVLTILQQRGTADCFIECIASIPSNPCCKSTRDREAIPKSSKHDNNPLYNGAYVV